MRTEMLSDKPRGVDAREQRRLSRAALRQSRHPERRIDGKHRRIRTVPCPPTERRHHTAEQLAQVRHLRDHERIDMRILASDADTIEEEHDHTGHGAGGSSGREGLSNITVTGPSFTMCTFIIAPKTPVLDRLFPQRGSEQGQRIVRTVARRWLHRRQVKMRGGSLSGYRRTG